MSKAYSTEIEAPGDDNDPDVLARRSRLSRLRDEKGNLGIELLESVIPHLPPGEPERAEVECMVAWAYFWMGDSARAVTIGERALTVQLDKLGLDHPETFLSLVELGCRYLELNRNEDAAERFTRVLQGPIITETLDENDYHKVLESGITQAYRSLGEWDKLREAKAKFRALRTRPRLKRVGVRRSRRNRVMGGY
jgi:hypothetical protein